MLYDYLDEEIIQDVFIDNIEEITEDIYDEYLKLRRFETLSIYCPSYIGRAILAELLEFDDTYINEDSATCLLRKDDEEVLITLSYDGDIFVEEAHFEGEILNGESVLNYVYDSFKQNDVIELSKDADPILIFGFKDKKDNENDDYNFLDDIQEDETDNTTVIIIPIPYHSYLF